ncbi:MAG: hypothetical protein H6506_03735 [Calditrichaeota bacterium]|nr:hypothetical protein [Calditrichota bacterium]MCB9391744.1 hypothetical protein [Calditrichota bacterium]
MNIVAGGNGSGKTLLGSAILAAALPGTTALLRRGLANAGLERVMISGHSGTRKLEWELDVRSGEVVSSGGNGEAGDPLTPIESVLGSTSSDSRHWPHFVVNGAWSLPDQDSLKWAEQMLKLPLEKELQSWQARLDALKGRDESGGALHEAETELARLLEIQARAKSQLEALAAAEVEAQEHELEISESDFRLHVSQAEERELAVKIELTERLLRLEDWVSELRKNWMSVEGAREKYAVLHDSLESLQDGLRGLPEDVGELAAEYQTLSSRFHSLSLQAAEQDEQRRKLTERLAAVQESLDSNREDLTAETVSQRDRVVREANELERELTELSRTRINLLRTRDGLLHTKQEKHREMTALSDDEWHALDQFLEQGSAAKSVAEDQEAIRERNELRKRLNGEFAGFDRLPEDVPHVLEKLKESRALTASLESELTELRERLADEGRRQRGNGLKIGLAALGALGAGLPVALSLGSDVGFFGAVLGGGAGYALAAQLTPAGKAKHDESVAKIERLQKAHMAALNERAVYEQQIAPLGATAAPDLARRRWEEYRAARRRLVELEQAPPPAARDTANNGVPALLRKLELEDIRRRVAEYRELCADIEASEQALREFESNAGHASSTARIESDLTRLRDQARALEQEINRQNEQSATAQAEADAERSQLESELRTLNGSATEQSALEELSVKIAALDESVGGAFSRRGPGAVLQDLAKRDELQAEIRDAKSLLSSSHTPQELATRTAVVESEIEEMTARIRDIDPLFAQPGSSADGLAKYRGQLDQVRDQMAEANEARILHESALSGLDLPALRSSAQELPEQTEIEESIARARGKTAELERSIETAQDMCSSLGHEVAEMDEKAHSEVLRRLNDSIFEPMGEKIAGVEPSQQGWIAILDDGQRRPIAALPRGLSELASLCLNAGVLSCSAQTEVLPLVWDDVLSQLDEHHLAVAHRVIERLAETRQVILLSRDSRMRNWGQPAELLVGRHELDLVTHH